MIVGNWKLNPLSLADAEQLLDDCQSLAEAHPTVHVGCAPPLLWADRLRRRVGSAPLNVYAQNVAPARQGAFTGEVSAPLLEEAGIHGALIGHSERRSLFGEDDAQVNARLSHALRESTLKKLILCVGETLEERDAGRAASVVRAQLEAATADIEAAHLRSGRLVVAYEPVWAIGTGRTATPEQANEIHLHIRDWWSRLHPETALTILYGGSVKPSNAAELLAQPHIDGALVGGASLKAETFEGIISAAAKVL